MDTGVSSWFCRTDWQLGAPINIAAAHTKLKYFKKMELYKFCLMRLEHESHKFNNIGENIERFED